MAIRRGRALGNWNLRLFLAFVCLITLEIIFAENFSSKPFSSNNVLGRRYWEETKENCEQLVVRTQLGLQSSALNECKTPKSTVKSVCLPLCGTTDFVVDVADNAGDDVVRTESISKCSSITKVSDPEKILVLFRMTRVFNGFHMYHVLNNFVVNLDPLLLDKYIFHCWGDWGCPVEFSYFFDKVLNLNRRIVTEGCYNNFIFIGEHYATYNVDRNDQVKARRWREWASIFRATWCPANILPFDDRFFTHLDRKGAQNGRNMNNCELNPGERTRYIIPSLDNVAEASRIFCNTRLLLSAEGNGLTNMLLLPPNSVVVVVWQGNRDVSALRSIYGNMAKLLGVTMVPIPVASDEKLNANCSADLNELFKALF